MCQAVALSGRRGLLLTRETAAAVCLANRRRGVRAAWAMDLPAAQRAVADVAANVLAVDPNPLSRFTLQRMAHCLAAAPDSPTLGRMGRMIDDIPRCTRGAIGWSCR
jgi:hypothetical protein